MGVVTASSLFELRRQGVSPSSVTSRSQTPAIRESQHIFDKSPNGQEVLLSKNSAGDLWLRDVNGHERSVGRNVIRATFSPDGKKIAYDTSDTEIFVETITGKHLAHLTRATDHAWSSNSESILFSATASADYPQLEQTVIYDLRSDRVWLRSSHK